MRVQEPHAVVDFPIEPKEVRLSLRRGHHHQRRYSRRYKSRCERVWNYPCGGHECAAKVDVVLRTEERDHENGLSFVL
jgi:hypothetical protein